MKEQKEITKNDKLSKTSQKTKQKGKRKSKTKQKGKNEKEKKKKKKLIYLLFIPWHVMDNTRGGIAQLL